jgi:hypothetical protein
MTSVVKTVTDRANIAEKQRSRRERSVSDDLVTWPRDASDVTSPSHTTNVQSRFAW